MELERWNLLESWLAILSLSVALWGALIKGIAALLL